MLKNALFIMLNHHVIMFNHAYADVTQIIHCSVLLKGTLAVV